MFDIADVVGQGRAGMRLSRSPTVAVLGLLGVVMGAIGLLSLGSLVGATALAVVAAVAGGGLWLERRSHIDEAVRFKPTRVAELDALRCGVDETTPWLLEKTPARDGESLLRFVPRWAGGALSRDLAANVAAERSVLVGLLGESKAGKTRCMFEVLRDRVPNALLFAPRGGCGLRAQDNEDATVSITADVDGALAGRSRAIRRPPRRRCRR